MNAPFDLLLWQQGHPVVTRGGGRPTILGFNATSVYGTVNGKEVEWTRDGMNVIRPEYGHDLQMLDVATDVTRGHQ
jgi:hypothetical protein